jgi:putative spermidine/putrescine transport system permease protein
MRIKFSIFFHIAMIAVCVIPISILLLLSFSKNWAFPALLSDQFSSIAWSDLFSGGNDIRHSLLLSILIAIIVAIAATTIGFFISKTIAYHSYRRQLLFLAYLPFVLSPVILAVCLKFYFIKLSLAGTIAGVIIAQLIIAIPYSIIFFSGFWNQKIKLFEQIVNTLGGTNIIALTKVIIPLSKPLLLVCFFQCFLISWFEYGLTSVIGYGKIQTLTIKVYQFLTEANIFYAALSCCLLIIPPVLLLWINKSIFLKYLH